METLPPEMLAKVTKHLSPEDLARCCGVSRGWRDIFNEDCHWIPYCDPSLEEHLRTTPSVVEPAFVAPESTNSSLTPISRWRLAWLREKHLWKNLKQENHKTEDVQKLKNEFGRDFLTNNLIVIWCSDRIEIWDVSLIPATFVAKTDPSIDLRDFNWLHRCVVGSCMLLVQQKARVKVFYVDAVNKCIQLKHDIPMDEAFEERHKFFYCHKISHPCFVKGNVYVMLSPKRLNLEIINIETGEKIKKEPCPVMGGERREVLIMGIKSSPYSDYVVVLVDVTGFPSNTNFTVHCYLYSLEQLTFLPGPKGNFREGNLNCFATYGPYLVVCERPTHTTAMKIYNCQSMKPLYALYYDGLIYPHAFNDGFIFTVNRGANRLVEKPVLKDTKVMTRYLRTFKAKLEIINDRIVRVFDGEYARNVGELWEASGQSKCLTSPFTVIRGYKINRMITRGIYDDLQGHFQDLSIYHYW